MRKLQTRDMFKAIRVVKVTGLKEELKEVVKQTEIEKTKRENEIAKLQEKVLEETQQGVEPSQILKDEILNLQSSNLEIGFDVVFTIMEKVSEAKTEAALYDFLSGPLEVTAKEVEEMDLTKMITEFKESLDLENWLSFFKSVSALTEK